MSSTPSQEPGKKSICISEFCSQHRTRIALSSFYFFFETCFSFKLFFMPVYWQQLGLSPTQIGILRAVWGVAYSLGGVIFGKMASKRKIRRALLMMSILSTAIIPLVSLIPRRTHDECSVELGKNLDENKRRIITPQEGKNSPHPNDEWIKSHVESKANENTNRRNQTHALQSLFRREEKKPEILEQSTSRRSLPPIKKRTPRQAPLVGDHVLILEKNPQDIDTIFLIFLFIVFVGELLASPAFGLANSEIVDYLGENSRDFGFSRMTSSAVSVVFLGFTSMCVKKTGYSGITVFSMMLFFIWSEGMSLMKNPWLMLLFETISYTAYVTGFTGVISYFGEVTPNHLMDTVQGGVNSLFLGVGFGVGTALCGFFIDAFGAVEAFRLFALGEAVLLVLFVVNQVIYFCLKKNEKEEKTKLLE
ncbi:uncharacterized protein LOC113673225 [Pocillopora damicornis]|uniref:uncharacterized protein LOC113673225 n=1 Tax=Pocillopora damicornis TaxID=46731 RepID=UPI000F552AFC|nr:uncharacterized protein LOC113673225 [Pocillopora damicornis]